MNQTHLRGEVRVKGKSLPDCSAIEASVNKRNMGDRDRAIEMERHREKEIQREKDHERERRMSERERERKVILY